MLRNPGAATYVDYCQYRLPKRRTLRFHFTVNQHTLTKMQAAQIEGIVRSSQLTRTVFTRLVRTGFLEEIMRGWYFVATQLSPLAQPSGTPFIGVFFAFTCRNVSQKITACFQSLPFGF